MRLRAMQVTTVAVVAAVGLDFLLAYLVVEVPRGAPLALGGVLMFSVVLLVALFPRQALLSLALLWGCVHTVLADYAIGSLGGTPMTISRAAGVAVTFGLAGALVMARPLGVKMPLPLRALFVFALFFAGVSLVLAPPATALGDIIRVWSGVAICLVSFRVFDTETRLLQLTRACVLGGVVIAAITLLEFALVKVNAGLAHAVFGNAYVTSYGEDNVDSAVRAAGPLGSPGATSTVLLILIAFALLGYGIRLETGRRRRGEIAAIIVMAGAIVATLSRTGIGALVVFAGVWLLQRQLTRRSVSSLRLKTVSAAAVCALMALPIIHGGSLRARLWDVNPAASGTAFAQGRGLVWQSEMATLRHSSPSQLLIGHGAHASYVAVAEQGPQRILSPHNLVFWLLVETGYVGAAIYAFFVFGTLAYFSAAARRLRFSTAGIAAATALAVAIAYVLVDMFTLTVNSPGNRWYWMLLLGAAMRLTSGARSGRPAADVA